MPSSNKINPEDLTKRLETSLLLSFIRIDQIGGALNEILDEMRSDVEKEDSER